MTVFIFRDLAVFQLVFCKNDTVFGQFLEIVQNCQVQF